MKKLFFLLFAITSTSLCYATDTWYVSIAPNLIPQVKIVSVTNVHKCTVSQQTSSSVSISCDTGGTEATANVNLSGTSSILYIKDPSIGSSTASFGNATCYTNGLNCKPSSGANLAGGGDAEVHSNPAGAMIVSLP